MPYKRSDFRIAGWSHRYGNKFALRTADGEYLHSDGSIIDGYTEYWPTEAAAQAVLDKFYPEPPRVWRHGDVFKTRHGLPMVFLCPRSTGARAYSLDSSMCSGPSLNAYRSITDAEFLFNIAEKL